eukprot:m.162373 g.162373  ORF g.162373 m.162373 type:complete len:499 (+) comp14603_c1_seq1:19-1515(+)
MPVKRALLVAEKPSVAKGIANLLSPGTRSTAGAAQYNRIFELKYRINNEDYDVQCTSVSGHFKELDFVQSHRKWHSCHPRELFQAPITSMVKEEFSDLQKQLRQLARRAQLLIVATDNDREGESIGYEIIDECRAVNSRIQVKRMKFTSLTAHQIRQALDRLVEPNKHEADACDARSEIDLRVGAAFTRFQTLRLQQMYQALADDVVSYGGCQFPTLGFVVDRYRQREDHVAEDFWKLAVRHEVQGEGAVDFQWERYRLFDGNVTQLLLDRCLSGPSPRATVTSVTAADRQRWRPAGLNTTELQMIASRKFRMDPQRCLNVAEKLYNRQILSYPRTENDTYKADMPLAELVQHQTVDPRWGAFATNIVTEGPNPQKGKSDTTDHDPIHPLKHAAPGEMDPDEQKVYEIVVRLHPYHLRSRHSKVSDGCRSAHSWRACLAMPKAMSARSLLKSLVSVSTQRVCKLLTADFLRSTLTQHGMPRPFRSCKRASNSIQSTLQ